MTNEEIASAAVEWLQNIRQKVRDDVNGNLFASLLLDTQPEGISFKTLDKFKADPARLSSEEIALIRQDKVINAIKCVRERTGIGLKEAKGAVDNWIDTERAAGREPLHRDSTYRKFNKPSPSDSVFSKDR